ncbi:LCP family protein [Tumebacillus permanentifrigoris]|uniref:LytR family transcriptional attenuator n=1 Tax=Tumebacillus permanentifrigoris TaxID=378543 RepID=A0A316DEQ2_9BACL|nr:LCP family protein [Tumebacillus permanentifrigoris]PWK16216.1 LytR family transcriptional attenuator [Tumebacillus permanentifrigoris]
MTRTPRRSTRYKKVRTALLATLGLLLLLSVLGFYKFYLLADRIYQPAPQAETSQTPTPHKQSELLIPPDELRERISMQNWYTTSTPDHSISKRTLQELGQAQASAPAKAAEPTPAPESANPFAKWLSGHLPSTDTKKGQTFLLLGVDSRKGESARSDTIVLATLPAGSQEVYLMSIPRDTRANVPGHGWTKINHAMSWGGLPLMKKTVEQLLNVPIDHTVTVDFEGFRQIVDRMGGLDVTVEKTMRYYDPTDGTNISLRAGDTLKSGQQALDYARFRADALADTGRMQRQQVVIRAMIQKGSEPSNWPKLVKTLDILGDHVKTDVPPRDWMSLVMRYSGTRADTVKTLSLTGENRISKQDNLWYFYVEEAQLHKMSRQLQQLRRGNS